MSLIVGKIMDNGLIKISSLYFKVRNITKQSRKRPDCIVKHRLNEASFDESGKLHLTIDNVRLRPYKHRPSVVNVELNGEVDRTTGDICVNVVCTNKTNPEVVIEAIRYNLTVVATQNTSNICKSQS